MPLYSKNGGIPKPQIDGTNGWVQVLDPPEVPDGMELVWWSYEWVVRPPKPEDRDGYQWNWNHIERQWVESSYATTSIESITIEYADSIAADSVGADSV